MAPKGFWPNFSNFKLIRRLGLKGFHSTVSFLSRLNVSFTIFFFFPVDRFQPELNQASKEALLVYQDDSSDELNDKLDEMLLPASDTDNDDWDTNNDAVEADSSDAEADDVVEVLDEG